MQFPTTCTIPVRRKRERKKTRVKPKEGRDSFFREDFMMFVSSPNVHCHYDYCDGLQPFPFVLHRLPFVVVCLNHGISIRPWFLVGIVGHVLVSPY